MTGPARTTLRSGAALAVLLALVHAAGVVAVVLTLHPLAAVVVGAGLAVSLHGHLRTLREQARVVVAIAPSGAVMRVNDDRGTPLAGDVLGASMVIIGEPGGTRSLVWRDAAEGGFRRLRGALRWHAPRPSHPDGRP